MLTEYSTSIRSKTSPTPTRVATPSPRGSSRIKAVIVNALAMILAWRPTLAMALGRLVLRVWPFFRRA
jgi:hypothetical protein